MKHATLTALAALAMAMASSCSDFSLWGDYNNPHDSANRSVTTISSAYLSSPLGLALDSAGNLYIANSSNATVARMDTSGNFSIVAGTSGSSGYSGDNVPATSAMLSSPTGLAISPSGELYIADTGNNRIRKVDSSGVISTVAGNSSSGYSGDNTLATSTSLSSPSYISLDSAGCLYISDTGNNRIRKVDAVGYISTVAGTGSSGYSADPGAALSSAISSPIGLVAYPPTLLLITDGNGARVRKIDTNGTLSLVASIHSGNNYAWLNGPMALDRAGNVYVGSSSGIFKLHGLSSTFRIIAGMLGGNSSNDWDAAVGSSGFQVKGIAVLPDGDLYFTDGYQLYYVH